MTRLISALFLISFFLSSDDDAIAKNRTRPDYKKKYPSGIGRRLFNDASLSDNGLSCASCHHTPVSRGNGLIKCGPDIIGKRESYKKSRFLLLMDAAVDCQSKYMLKKRLDRVQRAYLHRFLEGGSPGGVKKQLSYPKSQLALPEKLGGNHSRGRKYFFAACNVCHPDGRKGIGPDLFGSGLNQREVATIIRSGIQPENRRKTPMPAFGSRSVNDRTLGHISAYTSELNIFSPRIH